jgi:hypothetical protein
VRELVLDDPAPFVPLVMKKHGKEIDYEAKTVMLAGAALHRLLCRVIIGLVATTRCGGQADVSGWKLGDANEYRPTSHHQPR